MDENIKEILTNDLIASIFNPTDRKIMIKLFWTNKDKLGITKEDLKKFANAKYNEMLSQTIMTQIKSQMGDDTDFVIKFLGVNPQDIPQSEREEIKKLSFVPDKIKEIL